MKKLFSLGLTATAIALSTTSLRATETYSQNSSDTIFVCTTDNTTSTMYAYTPGNAVLAPLMSWHQEYLLTDVSSGDVCQKTADKLQTLSQEQIVRYIATEEQPDQTIVCMVTGEDSNCSAEDSEQLFGVNPNYNPSCILDRLEPLECSAMVMYKRGGVLETLDSPYRPIWWPW